MLYSSLFAFWTSILRVLTSNNVRRRIALFNFIVCVTVPTHNISNLCQIAILYFLRTVITLKRTLLFEKLNNFRNRKFENISFVFNKIFNIRTKLSQINRFRKILSVNLLPDRIIFIELYISIFLEQTNMKIFRVTIEAEFSLRGHLLKVIEIAIFFIG